MKQIVCYYHAAAGVPTKVKWLKAIKARLYATWPMLMTKAMSKYSPESAETQKGHMRQQQQGISFTEKEEEQIVVHTKLSPQTRDIFVEVVDMKQVMYTNQARKFPVVSSEGNKYIMVLCEIARNLILVKLVNTRTLGEMSRA